MDLEGDRKGKVREHKGKEREGRGDYGCGEKSQEERNKKLWISNRAEEVQRRACMKGKGL